MCDFIYIMFTCNITRDGDQALGAGQRGQCGPVGDMRECSEDGTALSCGCGIGYMRQHVVELHMHIHAHTSACLTGEI